MYPVSYSCICRSEVLIARKSDAWSLFLPISRFPLGFHLVVCRHSFDCSGADANNSSTTSDPT